MSISQAQEQKVCDKKLIVSFVANRLGEDDRLEFLFHLDECPDCWDEVYIATKAAHPHFYKKKATRKKKAAGKPARLTASAGS